MKKFSFLALALVLMPLGAMSLHAEDKTTIKDYSGQHEVKITDPKIGEHHQDLAIIKDHYYGNIPLYIEGVKGEKANDNPYATSYTFWKSCMDSIGCPGEFEGVINGYNFLVYRAYFNADNTQAYYSGWIYN